MNFTCDRYITCFGHLVLRTKLPRCHLLWLCFYLSFELTIRISKYLQKSLILKKAFGPIVQEGRSLLKKTEGACPKRITTTHGEYTALQWTTVGGARNLHRKSNCHNSWFTPFSLIKDLYLTSLNKKRFLGWKGKNYYPIQIKFISYVMRGHTIMLNHNFFKLFQNKPTWNKKVQDSF